MIPVVLACAWGILASLPVLAFAGRVEATRRARALAAGNGPARVPRIVARSRRTLVGRVAAGLWRARRRRRAAEAVRRDLPVAVDLVHVAVAAGCTPHQAVELAARFAPAPVAAPLAHALRAVALGRPFDEAIGAVAAKEPLLAPLARVVRTGAATGTSIGRALTRLADEVRADARRRSETRARTVPVRLLFPLVFCALPAFALLTVVPVVIDKVPF